jgi:anti-sigma regulatory factor (Ser/Thr protein kinase)
MPVPAHSAETTSTAPAETPPPRFAMRCASTPRAARRARRLVAEQLEQWGYLRDTDAHQSMVLIAGELCANAVRHGHVPGRDFRLCLTATETATTATLRIEVTDARGELRPEVRSDQQAAEGGRGLLIVGRLAHRWAVLAHPPTLPGKTVWAEVDARPTVPDGDIANGVLH